MVVLCLNKIKCKMSMVLGLLLYIEVFLLDDRYQLIYGVRLSKMVTHSSVLALRISGTGEPGGLPSMGSHRVGHD